MGTLINPSVDFVHGGQINISGNNCVQLKDINSLSVKSKYCEHCYIEEHGLVVGICEGAKQTKMYGCPLIVYNKLTNKKYLGTKYVFWFKDEDARNKAFEDIAVRADHLSPIKK